MKHISALLTAILTVVLYSWNPAFCSEPGKHSEVTQPPPGRDAAWRPVGDTNTIKPPIIRKLKEGVLLVGEVTVNKPENHIRVHGEVNMNDGLVEYLACGPMGKLHESVLVLHAQPYHLQVALLLLGLEPGNNPLERQGGPGVPEGDPVEIWVIWRSANQKKVRHRAEELIFNIKEKKAMPHTHWVYTGSQIIDGQFIAQLEQSIIATYHDPFAMFDHPLATGMDDTLYYANKKLVPPKGTAVTLVIKPVTAQKRKTPRPLPMNQSAQ